jgi:hypothetical protein
VKRLEQRLVTAEEAWNPFRQFRESLINFILVQEQTGFGRRSWCIEKSKGYNIKQKEQK